MNRCVSLIASAALASVLFVAPAQAEPYRWSGFYIGAHAGHGWGDWDGTIETTAGCPGTCPSAGYDNPNHTLPGNGWLGGGQLGYNWQSGSLVLGLEADISRSNMSGSGQFATDQYNPWVWDKSFNASLDYFGTARARLGVANGGLLLYGTGGFAWGRTSGTIGVAQSHDGKGEVIDGVSHAFSRDNHTGWTLGGGLEYALGRNWSLKAEYLYVDLGRQQYLFKDGTVFDAGVVPFDTDSFPADLTIHTVRVGINYKLD